MPISRRDLTKPQADELMANIRTEDPDAQLELISQPNGLFTVNIKSAAPTGEHSTTNAPTTASEALQLGDPTVQPDSALLNGPSWIEIARSQIGTKEIPGAGNNPAIENYFVCTTGGPRPDDVPWCGAFVSFCLARAQVITQGSARAADWLRWGVKLDTPQLGCIVVLKPQTAGASGHVGFWVGEEGGMLSLLGGNQGNEVKVSHFVVSEVQPDGYRWPS